MANINPEIVRGLVEQRWPGMVLFARQWSQEPEDVVQDALIKLVQQKQSPNDLLAWLYRVIRNEAISRQRRHRNRAKREANAASRNEWFASLDDRVDSQMASAALRGLPSDLREVVIGRIWGQLTFQQIADACQISVATAYRRYERALEDLRGHMQTDCEAEAEDGRPERP